MRKWLRQLVGCCGGLCGGVLPSGARRWGCVGGLWDSCLKSVPKNIIVLVFCFNMLYVIKLSINTV